MWLFYNKKLFDESGLAYPTPDTTWEEYVELARKLTETDSSGRITQFGSNGWEWWTFPVAQAVWSNGGCFYYNDDMTNTCVDDPKTVQALQGIADLIHVHKVAPSPLSPPAVPVGLLSDNVGMEANGDYLPWDQRDVFDAKYDYLDATLCPTWGGKRVNIYWPDCFLINARSSPEVQAAAYKWVSWFACDPESIAIQCKVVFPVVKRAYDDAEIAQRWLVRPRPPGMIKAAMQHTQTARYWMADLRINDLDEIYYGEISRLWNGDATAEEVCRVIQEEMSKIMAKPVDL
jgi:multiple sugar transport system substrate-binding protein